MVTSLSEDRPWYEATSRTTGYRELPGHSYCASGFCAIAPPPVFRCCRHEHCHGAVRHERTCECAIRRANAGKCARDQVRNEHIFCRAEVEKRLAEGPRIAVPTITMEGDANGAPHLEPAAYARMFSGKYEHGTVAGGIGHNLPQGAPQAFAAGRPRRRRHLIAPCLTRSAEARAAAL